MLRKFIMTILVFVFYLLQCTLFKTWALASVSPNLLLILTFAAGFMGGRKNGMYVGIISGLMLDLFYGSTLGFNTLILLYIGYVNGMFNKMFYDEEITLPVVLVVGSELSYSFVYSDKIRFTIIKYRVLFVCFKALCHMKEKRERGSVLFCKAFLQVKRYDGTEGEVKV